MMGSLFQICHVLWCVWWLLELQIQRTIFGCGANKSSIPATVLQHTIGNRKKNVMRARGLVALSKCEHKSQLSACVYLVLDVERFYYRRLNISFRDRRKTATIEISRGLSSQINCGRIDEKITRWSCVTSTDTAYHIDLASRTIHNSQWHLPLPVLFRQPLWLFRLFGPFARVCDKVPLNLTLFCHSISLGSSPSFQDPYIFQHIRYSPCVLRTSNRHQPQFRGGI